MGAIWAARDFCLFLLLLNSRQSTALPEIRGGTVVSVCLRVCECVLCFPVVETLRTLSGVRSCCFPSGDLNFLLVSSKCISIYKLLLL